MADTRHREVVAPVLITAANAAELLGAFFLKNALGYFLGAMLVIPLLLWLALPELRRGSGPMLKEVGLVLLPAAGAFLTLLMIFPEGRLAELLRLLLIAAVVVFAVRHGLRGAALSVLVVSLALGIEDHLWGASDSIIWLQTFVAIAGAMALMFGASMDQLRLQTAQLRQAREREQRILHDLAEAAARNVRAQELERGRIAMDLHDSLGQDITALQTELKLIQLESEAARPWTHQLLGLALHMRTTLREALEALRPAALVELGLAKAVDLGVIRESAERSGLFFELRLPRDPRALNQLDAATSIAAYRIVQEAVNNVIRHAEAEWVSVRLRVGRRNSRRWLLVSIEDDGRGRSPAVFGRGLQGIRDRAITLTGDLRVTQRCKGGTRVRAWLRLEPEKALGEPYAEPAH
ncbi:MAG: histidine kinase [Aquimonas sp.]|nr:histidine kinase [Aquimonas sp.]